MGKELNIKIEVLDKKGIDPNLLKRIEKMANRFLRGSNCFGRDVTERVQSYSDSCFELGIEPMDEQELMKKGFTAREIAVRKLETITEALNKGWNPDWNDSNQQKWRVWLIADSGSAGGFRFDGSYCGCSSAYAGCGSRLYFKTKALADYAGEKFIKLYAETVR